MIRLRFIERAVQQNDHLGAQRAILCFGVLTKALVERFGNVADVERSHTAILAELVAQCNTNRSAVRQAAAARKGSLTGCATVL